MIIQIQESFQCNPERLWRAITEPSEMRQWYFDIENFSTQIGHTFTFYEPITKKYLHECKIIDCIPLKKFEHTWAYPSHSKGLSQLKWELNSKGNETELILTHTGIENLEDAGVDFKKENFEKGWREFIQVLLKKYINQ